MLLDQGGLCAICQQHMDRPHVDHNHETDAVRSLLCMKCNFMIGLANEDTAILQKGIDYLNAWRDRE